MQALHEFGAAVANDQSRFKESIGVLVSVLALVRKCNL